MLVNGLTSGADPDGADRPGVKMPDIFVTAYCDPPSLTVTAVLVHTTGADGAVTAPLAAPADTSKPPTTATAETSTATVRRFAATCHPSRVRCGSPFTLAF